MLTRRGVARFILALLGVGAAASVVPATSEWKSFTAAGVELAAVRLGDVVTGSDGRRWRVGMMPNGRLGLRAA